VFFHLRFPFVGFLALEDTYGAHQVAASQTMMLNLAADRFDDKEILWLLRI